MTQASISLGNRLKELRQKNNLSQNNLAEQLKCSHAFIGFIEKGTRNPSNEMIEKFAEFFNVPQEELIALRDRETIEYPSVVKVAEPKNPFPHDVQELAETLIQIDDRSRSIIIEEIKELINKKLYDLLIPFQMVELKKMVLEVKRVWMNSITEEKENETLFRSKIGRFTMEEKSVFFLLELEDIGLTLTLLEPERKHVHVFESWIDEWNVSYHDQIKIPHLKGKQRVVSFIWFNPAISVVDRFKELQNKKLNVNTIRCNDRQLKWFLNQQQLQFDQDSAS